MDGAAYPPPTAQGYPEKGYPPQQQPYPPQQQPYPPQQQPYPSQPYPQQYPSDYKPAEPAPPYYPPQQQPAPAVQQQSSTNVVVVGSQPTAAVVTVSPTGDYFLTLSIVMTILCAFCCSWWALFCTIPAIIFASNARDTSSRGDAEGAKRMGYIALGLNIAAVASYIVLWIIIISISVSVSGGSSSSSYSSCYYNYYYYSYYCYK